MPPAARVPPAATPPPRRRAGPSTRVVLCRAWAPPRKPLCQLTARQGCSGRYRQVLGAGLKCSESARLERLAMPRPRAVPLRCPLWRLSSIGQCNTARSLSAGVAKAVFFRGGLVVRLASLFIFALEE